MTQCTNHGLFFFAWVKNICLVSNAKDIIAKKVNRSVSQTSPKFCSLYNKIKKVYHQVKLEILAANKSKFRRKFRKKPIT